MAELRPSPGASATRHPLPAGEGRFRSYNRWLQEKFGERVYKVIVDAGFTCPNRDGTVAVGGCIYCNNASFSPGNRRFFVAAQLEEGKSLFSQSHWGQKFITYFPALTNNYRDMALLPHRSDETLASEA